MQSVRDRLVGPPRDLPVRATPVDSAQPPEDFAGSEVRRDNPVALRMVQPFAGCLDVDALAQRMCTMLFPRVAASGVNRD